MKNKDVIILEKIIRYCDEIDATIKQLGDSKEEFVDNFIYRNACSMCILQIGELCKNISESIREKYAEVQWRAWCGIRDIFAHQYTNMDYDIAWETLKVDVPKLREQAEEILNKINKG